MTRAAVGVIEPCCVCRFAGHRHEVWWPIRRTTHVNLGLPESDGCHNACTHVPMNMNMTVSCMMLMLPADDTQTDAPLLAALNTSSAQAQAHTTCSLRSLNRHSHTSMHTPNRFSYTQRHMPMHMHAVTRHARALPAQPRRRRCAWPVSQWVAFCWPLVWRAKAKAVRRSRRSAAAEQLISPRVFGSAGAPAADAATAAAAAAAGKNK
jgi:hypothetical protein